MKIQIRRVKRAEQYEHNRVDEKFVNGTIRHIPQIGERLTVQFDRLGYGTWHTTPVVERTATKTHVVVKTVNSTYHIKFGWGEN